MCMFCAAVPVAGALGAKFNADQKRNNSPESGKTEKPVPAITLGVMVLLLMGSVVYHSTMYNQ